MRNLAKFIYRYHAFFIFLIFFIFSLQLVIKNNSYQHAQTVKSTRIWVAYSFQKINFIQHYLNLGKTNDSLTKENALLKQSLLSIQQKDTAQSKTITDTITKKQFTFLPARIIKNSVTLRNNVLTLDKGSNDGIEPGMAVLPTGNGVVGFIKDVSPHFSTVISLLNKDTKISAWLAKNHAFGSVVWGDGNFDYRTAMLSEIPNNIKVKKGDLVLTSPYSSFPANVPIGKVIQTGIGSNTNSFADIKIALFCDFSTLQNVYVVKNNKVHEQQKLEQKSDGKSTAKK